MSFDDGHILSYDNIVYFTGISAYGVAKVWRLEEKHSQISEGEARSQELRQFVLHLFAYDCVRKALFIGDRRNGELFALHLSSSRLEILSEFPVPLLDNTHEVHRNTLAPLYGAKREMDGLTREFRQMGLSVRWICRSTSRCSLSEYNLNFMLTLGYICLASKWIYRSNSN